MDPRGAPISHAKASFDTAAAGEGLRLLYQPIIRLADMLPICVEVLARTMTPAGVLEGPDTLLAAMADQESSMALTGMIMRRGLREHVAAGLDRYDLTVIYNMPLDAMLHPGMVGIIKAIRAEGRDDLRVGFELTERHPVEDVARVGEVVTALGDAGYGVALDDVTPATPNLFALIELPLRTVKLDYSVVARGTPANIEFIRSVVAATAPRGQFVVAEGIETLEILRLMKELGVTHGQGFLFARPMTAEMLPAFLDGWRWPDDQIA